MFYSGCCILRNPTKSAFFVDVLLIKSQTCEEDKNTLLFSFKRFFFLFCFYFKCLLFLRCLLCSQFYFYFCSFITCQNDYIMLHSVVLNCPHCLPGPRTKPLIHVVYVLPLFRDQPAELLFVFLGIVFYFRK